MLVKPVSTYQCRKWFILGLFALFSMTTGHAQSLAFQQINTNSGLITNYIYDIEQDARGVLWMATPGGIMRYDGYRFTNYTVKQGLTTNEILSLFQDQQGRIWCKAYFSAPCFIQADTVVNPQNSPLLARFKNNKQPLGFGQGKDKKLYLSIGRDDLYVLNEPANKAPAFERLNIFLEKDTQDVKEVYVAPDSTPWVITPRNLKTTTGPTFQSPLQLPFSYQYPRNCVLANGKLLLWLGYKPLLFNGKELQELPYFKEVPKNEAINGLYQDKQGFVWVCTFNGVYQFTKDFTFVAHYLAGIQISNALEDNEGNLWFTSLGKGLFVCYNRYLSILNRQTGLPNETIYGLGQLANGTLLLGHEGGGYSWKAPRQNWQYKQVAPSIPGRNRIHTLLELPGQNGLMLLSNNFLAILPTIGLAYQNILAGGRTLLQKKDGGYFIGYSTGMGSLNPNFYAEKWSLKDSERRAFPLYADYLNVYNLLAIDSGRYLMGTLEGLYVTDLKGTQPFTTNSNLRKRITALAKDENGYIWVGTLGYGLFCVQPDTILHFTTANGLKNDNVNKLLAVPAHGLYIGTHNGLHWLPQSNPAKPIRYLGLAQGLPEKEVQDLMVFNDSLLVATTQGLATIPLPWPKQMPQTTTPHFFVDSLVAGTSTYPYKAHSQLELPYNENSVSLFLTGINYKQHNQLYYRYRLQNNAPWRNTSSRRIDFAALAAGSYEITVQAMVDEYPSAQTAHLSIRVLPPFWKQWWFLALVQLLFTMLVVGIIYFRNRQKKQQRQLQSSLANAEQKALKAQMNPHFLFNALHRLHLFILKESPDAVYHYLERLGKLLRNILDFSGQKLVSLQEELHTLELYLALEKERHRHKFEVAIEVNEQLAQHALIPPMLIQPFAENAIKHGLLPLQHKKGMLTIKIRLVNERLQIQIIDNGVGRKQAQLNHHSPEQRSYGMSIARERLELLQKQERLPHHMYIEDLLDAQQQPAGTCVTLDLPYLAD